MPAPLCHRVTRQPHRRAASATAAPALLAARSSSVSTAAARCLLAAARARAALCSRCSPSGPATRPLRRASTQQQPARAQMRCVPRLLRFGARAGAAAEHPPRRPSASALWLCKRATRRLVPRPAGRTRRRGHGRKELEEIIGGFNQGARGSLGVAGGRADDGGGRARQHKAACPTARRRLRLARTTRPALSQVCQSPPLCRALSSFPLPFFPSIRRAAAQRREVAGSTQR